jgi:hypothetical protein
MGTKYPDLFAALTAPFSESEVRERNQAGRTLKYVTASTVANRLDSILGPEGWEFALKPWGDDLIGTLTIRLPDGTTVSKSNVGGRADMQEGDNDAKSAACLPIDAEALTRSGWRRHGDLSIGDEILAYDPASGICRWTKLLALNVYDQPQPVLEMTSKSFRMVCTPNHRWAVAHHWRDRATTVELKAAEHLNSLDCIVVAAPAEGGDSPLTAREAGILGWLATDGSVLPYRGRLDHSAGFPSHPRASICQSKEPHRSSIRELLGGDARESITAPSTRQFPGHATASATLERSQFQLRPSFARDLLHKAGLRSWLDLTPLVLSLSTKARTAMFHTMMAGDGTRNASGQAVFGKKAKPGVMEAFELLATLEGIALGVQRRSTVGDMPIRTLRRQPHTWAKCLTVRPAEDCPVWCPTTALGTWVARWQGTITITGNSDALKRCASLLGIARYLYGSGAPNFAAHHATESTREPARDERRHEANDQSRPREQEAPRPPVDGGNRRQDGTPKTGRALFAWVKKQEEQHGEGLLKYLNGFAKLQDWPGRMVEWSDAQVQAAHDEACRKLEQRAHEEALSN